MVGHEVQENVVVENVFWRWYIGINFNFLFKIWVNSKVFGEYFTLGSETTGGVGGGKFGKYLFCKKVPQILRYVMTGKND